MKILIHGRKNGYNILYPRPTPSEFYSFACDIQSISANNYELYYGIYFYTLAFVYEGCIFTKYVIGDDVGRGQLGEIGISVFIPHTERLKGADVKMLTDELINTYCRNYIFDNKIEDPRNGFDWALFTTLANSFDAKLLPRSSSDDNILSGTQEAAFHYYKSDSELIEHFDKPYQEEYSDYKQVLFIDNKLQSKTNPLNVLKNSGVEVNPDLKNEYFYLNNFNRNKEVTIKANEKLRSDKKGENQIRAKWQIEINYKKDDRCYEPINLKGTISDFSSEIHNYIEIKGNHILLKYDNFNPKPKTKSIQFIINDRNGKPIDGADIQIGTRSFERVSGSAKIIDFAGDDIIKRWKITVRKESENFFLDTITVIPYNQDESVVLTLQKQKVVTIFAIDKENGNNISNFKIWCNDGKGYRDNDTVVFLNDDIYKQWNIEVSKNEGWNTFLGKIENYCPAEGSNQLFIECEKSLDVLTKNKTYKIDAGEHGKKAEKCPSYSNSSRGLDLDKNCIVANKGYNFIYWELRNDTLVAQYEQKKTFFPKTIKFPQRPIVWATLILAAFALCIWTMYKLIGRERQPNEIPLTAEGIISYIEGDSLMPEKLEGYKKLWEIQKPTIETIGGLVWYNPTTWFVGSNEANTDSTKYKEWEKFHESIDRAITLRILLADKNFAELKNQEYFSAQQSFKTAIKKIDSTKYEEVGNQLGDVSALTLTHIADSINAILTPNEPKREEYKPKQAKETSVKTEEKQEQPMLQERKTSAPPTQTEADSNDKTSEIIHYIKGSELDEAKLKEYKNTKGINQNLKNSIQLCLDFWALDGSGSGKKAKTYWNFRDKVNADDNFINSKLKAFLDKMCHEGTSPSYSEQDKKKGLR